MVGRYDRRWGYGAREPSRLPLPLRAQLLDKGAFSIHSGCDPQSSGPSAVAHDRIWCAPVGPGRVWCCGVQRWEDYSGQ